MLRRAVVSLLFVSGLLAKAVAGQTSLVQTHQDVWAAAGEDADLSCQLLETTTIIQTTWQKKVPDGHRNIASHNKDHGHKVNQEFREKVEFKEVGEKNSSTIIIRNVTEEDEGCYWCVFMTFPNGRLSNHTCLHVYELHEPVLHIRPSWSPAESGVSCSATGRPVPMVTLTVSQQHLSFSQHNTTRVHNNNNTVTVTTTAVLSGLHDDSTQVGCVVGVASGAQIQVFQRIPERKPTSDDDVSEKSGSDFIWIPVTQMIFLGLSLFILLPS